MLATRIGDDLATFENVLVSHPVFGDSGYISAQYHQSCQRRLRVIAASLPSAGRLADALSRAPIARVRQACGNTVVRCAIQHAHTQVEDGAGYGMPLDDCAAIFDHYADLLERPGDHLAALPPHHALPTIRGDGGGPAIWSEAYPQDVFGRAFRFLVKVNYGDPLSFADPASVAKLQHGYALLAALLPDLAESALSHVQLVGIFPHAGSWKDKASSSQIRLGGSIFLSDTLLANPWALAEHLLHEALHQKLYDFRHGHTLLDPDFARRGAPRIVSVWNAARGCDANSWDAHRAVAAFHVYAQLAILARHAEQADESVTREYGPPVGIIASRKAYERARYLGEQLRTTGRDVLGHAGRQMVEWLMALLDVFDPDAPAKDATLHLWLDLYRREAQDIDWRQRTMPEDLRLKTACGALALREIDIAGEALAQHADTATAERFERDLADLRLTEPWPDLPKARELIGRAIAAASAAGHSLEPAPGAQPAALATMIAHGSRQLHHIVQNYDPVVVEAKERAHAERFGSSCTDEVGRLLAVLAASVRPGGHILEIGTGAGVGTAWIVSGLGGRTDVSLLSTEIDDALLAAVRGADWPDYVAFRAAVAGTWPADHARADLLFLDASEVKYRTIDTALDRLAPGGIVVIDDLDHDLADYEEQKITKGRLRLHLANRADLVVLELNWATGVIIAARRG